MSKKYRVGYTTGVYDMFHIGHLNLLRRAKEQCDYLIVGVSTDELVQKTKNKTPIIPLEDRMEIIRAIKYVDEVVPQYNKDKIAAYHKYKFDAMFVGDDWKGSELFSKCEAELKKFGTDVVYFPYTKKISSTKLREQLQKGTTPAEPLTKSPTQPLSNSVSTKSAPAKHPSLFRRLSSRLAVSRKS